MLVNDEASAVFLFALICSAISQECSSPCACEGFIEVDDTAQPGDVVKSFSSVEADAILSGCAGFYLNGSDLVLNRTLRDPCISDDIVHCECSANLVSTTWSVAIEHKDIYPPAFPYDVYNATIPEDAVVGTLVIQFSAASNAAVDPDCGQSLNYGLEQNGDGLFSVLAAGMGDVRLQRPLDYTDTSRYSINVSVDSNDKKDYARLDIYVLDADNLPPKFLGADYSLELFEESVDTALLTTTPPLLCEDQDYGINETINYSFADGTNTTEYFYIDQSSGMLLQLTPMDTDTTPTLSLEIKCYQVDKPSLRTTVTTVTVTILDINDNAPVFSPVEYPVVLMENHVGYVVTVSATDADQGENAKFTYEVVAGGDMFDINGESGVLTSSGLDREVADNVTVVVRAVDRFGNYSSNNATVSINLRDENDNNPQFTQSSYNFYFNASTSGTYIGKILATDADEANTPNSNVTYEIDMTLGDSGTSLDFPVSVDGETGVLTVAHSAEPHVVYSMLAKACDNPENTHERRCATVLVTTVLTVNTTFTSESLHVQLMENAKIGTIVTPVPIIGDFYEISVSQFDVDLASDMIITSSEMDRERTSMYTFTINVTSIRYGAIGNVSVTVEILDVNDNVPQFADSVFYLPLPDRKQADRTVGQIIGTDADADEAVNGNVTYAIHELVFYDIFTLNSVTGEVAVADDWWQRPQTFYRFTAIISDHGIPSLKSMATVYLMYFEAGEDFIRISTPAPKTFIDTNIHTLEIGIALVLPFEQVTITDVESASSDIPSVRAYLTFLAEYKNGTLIPGDILLRDIAEKWFEIQDVFLKYSSSYSTLSGDSGELETAEIALIAVAAAIFLGACVAIAVVCRQWNYYNKQNKLFDSMKKQIPAYDSQELHMSFDDDDDADSRASSVRQLTRPKQRGPPLDSSLPVNYINPMFTADEDISQKSPRTDTNITSRIPRWSTFDSIKDAMASLEDLSDRLNAEDSISGITNMSRSRKSSAGAAQIVLDPASVLGQDSVVRAAAGYLLPPADYPDHANGISPTMTADEACLPDSNSLYSEKIDSVFNNSGHQRSSMNGIIQRDRLTEEATAF